MRIILRVHDVQSMYGKPEESMTDNFMNFNTDTQIKKTEETKIKDCTKVTKLKQKSGGSSKHSLQLFYVVGHTLHYTLY